MKAREQARFDIVKPVGTFGTKAEKMGEWHTAAHVERQTKKKETPAETEPVNLTALLYGS